MSSKTDKQVPFKDAVQVALSCLEQQNTPRSLSVHILAQSYLLDSYDPIQFASECDALQFNPADYDQFTVNLCRADYLATNIFSKLPPLPGSDTSYLDVAAIEGFKRSEEKNSATNAAWSGVDIYPAEQQLASLGVPLEKIQGILRELLGRAPSWKTLNESLEWTVGSSVCLPRTKSSAEDKCEFGISITYQLATKLNALMKEGLDLNPLISREEGWFLTPGNLFDTVLKNIKTNRTIAKEADINMLFQRAIGKKISRRLRRKGIDLTDQTLNQRACMRAMVDRNATVDIKGASNSVCSLPIFKTWPADWIELLDTCRSHYGTYAPRQAVLVRDPSVCWFQYEMLSSMGNGFTFEVESAMFYAIARACGAEEHEVFVYGDDIILPQTLVPLFQSVLHVFGFEVNTEKSFTSGAFFESCGVYSFFGVDAAPFKIKELLYGSKDRIILANKIRWFAHVCRNHSGCDRRFLPAWQMCVRGLSSDVRARCRGPLGSGVTLWTNIDETRNLRYDRNRCLLKTYQLLPKVKYKNSQHRGVFIMRLAAIEGYFESFEEHAKLSLSLLQPRSTHRFSDELSSVARGNSTVARPVVDWKMQALYTNQWYQPGWWL